jgi:hypothetical protein
LPSGTRTADLILGIRVSGIAAFQGFVYTRVSIVTS